MPEMGTLLDFETTLDDNRFELEVNQPSFPEPSLGLGVMFYDDFDVFGWGETNFEGGIEFTKECFYISSRHKFCDNISDDITYVNVMY